MIAPVGPAEENFRAENIDVHQRFPNQPASNEAVTDRANRFVRQFIHDHPGVALGAATAIGLTLGWYFKRRGR